MGLLASLTVVVPLTVAAGFVALAFLAKRPAVDVLAALVAAAVTAGCAVLLVASLDGLAVTWLAGWEPRRGVAVGISLAVDPLAAGLATLASLLTTVALVFSRCYRLGTDEPFFHALMLVLLGGMVGFSFSADLFNLFVFFELVSVAAYVLVGFETEETAPLSGALNFAVTNSVGGSLLLGGVGLLYGRTGALSFAQVGRAVEAGPADALVVTAFALILVGLFVKAAVVPFHFWLADAYAVAPLPVCLVLAGAVSELGLYAVLRVYWTVFEGPLASHAAGVSAVLLTVGALTAVVGALMCFLQRHLKRLLAFATVSHVGVSLLGAALLSPRGLAGTAVYVVAAGCVKAGLFVCVGVLQHRCGTVDELHLRGRGRGVPLVGAIFVIGALAMTSLPPFGPFLGKALIDEAARAAGQWWVAGVLVVASVLTSGALLRAGGRIWLGWGPDEKAERGRARGDEEAHTTSSARRTPMSMLGPAVAVMAIGLLVGLAPGVDAGAVASATAFQDRQAYAATSLDRRPSSLADGGAAPEIGLSAYGYAALSLVASLALALFTLERHRLPGPLGGRPAPALGLGAVAGLRALHSGHVGDYVAWLTAGSAALAVALALVVA